MFYSDAVLDELIKDRHLLFLDSGTSSCNHMRGCHAVPSNRAPVCEATRHLS